jgi:hypothetical protein
MTLQEAVELLSSCVRHELRDHAFGDSEVYWRKDGQNVATGYFGGDSSSVCIGQEVFKGADALKLLECGQVGQVERNDETGPDEYKQGVIMPALTLEGVRKELTGE